MLLLNYLRKKQIENVYDNSTSFEWFINNDFTNKLVITNTIV